MDHYEALGIDPSFDGDLRVVRNRLVKQYSEAGATPDEERMKAINLAYERLRDRPVAARAGWCSEAAPAPRSCSTGGGSCIARPPRQPAAIAAPVLGVGASGAGCSGGPAPSWRRCCWLLVRQYQRVYRHRRGHRA